MDDNLERRVDVALSFLGAELPGGAAAVRERLAALADLEASAALHARACERGRALWQAAHPEQADRWPDGAANVAWLVERIHALEALVRAVISEDGDQFVMGTDWHARASAATGTAAAWPHEVLAYRRLGATSAVAQLRDRVTGALTWRYRAEGATVDFHGDTWADIDGMVAAIRGADVPSFR